jgi:hypothetical protein
MNHTGNAHRLIRWIATVGIAVGCAVVRADAQAPRSLTDSAFAALVARFSEQGGFFDTDNLISNEDSYLIPVSTLHRHRVSGGAYVGVGPEQNFSYIAAIRPNVAFIVDIRRDNLLEHLLFKAIFAESRGRADYLSLLFGRTPPADTAGWSARAIDSLIAAIERARPDSAASARIRTRIIARARAGRVPLSAADIATITRFHSIFIQAGPRLRFNTFGRAPQPYYPDYRRLATERDRDGNQAGFLASEALFQVMKSLEDRNLVIPVVGDFGGPRALTGIASWLRENNELLSAFYTSNVEQYLFRDGGFADFAASVARFPLAPNAVFIRSCFVCANGHPSAAPGYHAVPIVQRLAGFVELHAAGRLTSYGTLLNSALLPP